MTTDYVNTILAACPEPLLSEGNNLAGCLGESIADLQTYNTLNYQDADGVEYCVIQFAATNTVLTKVASGEVERPGFDTDERIDLALAQAGLDAIYQVSLSEEEEEGGPMMKVPLNTKDRIMYCLNYDSARALAAMGLALIPHGDEI